MSRARRRLRTNPRSSLRSNAVVIPCISVVAADVTVQMARPRPTTVISTPVPGELAERFRLSLSRLAAAGGITVLMRSMIVATSSGLATSEKTPRTTRKTAGIARNTEYARACAVVVIRSSRASAMTRFAIKRASLLRECSAALELCGDEGIPVYGRRQRGSNTRSQVPTAGAGARSGRDDDPDLETAQTAL